MKVLCVVAMQALYFQCLALDLRKLKHLIYFIWLKQHSVPSAATSIQRCKYGDGECITKAANNYLPMALQGKCCDNNQYIEHI